MNFLSHILPVLLKNRKCFPMRIGLSKCAWGAKYLLSHSNQASRVFQGSWLQADGESGEWVSAGPQDCSPRSQHSQAWPRPRLLWASAGPHGEVTGFRSLAFILSVLVGFHVTVSISATVTYIRVVPCLHVCEHIAIVTTARTMCVCLCLCLYLHAVSAQRVHVCLLESPRGCDHLF